MPPVHINVGGTWKECDSVHINVGGVWKEVDTGSVNVGGVWKETLTGITPVVTAQANGDTNNVSSGTCYVGVSFNNDDMEYERNASTGTYNVSAGQWLDVGQPSQVWVHFVYTSGNVSAATFGQTTGVYYNLENGKAFGFSTTSEILQTCTGYFEFYDNATGSGTPLQTTSTVSWRASVSP